MKIMQTEKREKLTAEELRIGNIVTSKQWNGYHKIDGILVTKTGFELHIKGFVHQFIEGKYFDIDPVVLTPEILEECGFKITKNGANIVYNEFGNIITLNKCDFGYTSVYLCSPINYLHQLQNYYYCLNGTELPINSLPL